MVNVDWIDPKKELPQLPSGKKKIEVIVALKTSNKDRYESTTLFWSEVKVGKNTAKRWEFKDVFLDKPYPIPQIIAKWAYLPEYKGE